MRFGHFIHNFVASKWQRQSGILAVDSVAQGQYHHKKMSKFSQIVRTCPSRKQYLHRSNHTAWPYSIFYQQYGYLHILSSQTPWVKTTIVMPSLRLSCFGFTKPAFNWCQLGIRVPWKRQSAVSVLSLLCGHSARPQALPPLKFMSEICAKQPEWKPGPPFQLNKLRETFRL